MALEREGLPCSKGNKSMLKIQFTVIVCSSILNDEMDHVHALLYHIHWLAAELIGMVSAF